MRFLKKCLKTYIYLYIFSLIKDIYLNIIETHLNNINHYIQCNSQLNICTAYIKHRLRNIY